MDNKHKESGFFNGFLLGLIIGAAAVFLLGTKKGKGLLKVITEEGIEGISEIGNIMEDIEEEKELDLSKESPNDEKPSISQTARRFFRGIKKKQ